MFRSRVLLFEATLRLAQPASAVAGGTAQQVAHEPRVPRGPGHATGERSRATGEGAARERLRSRCAVRGPYPWDRTRVSLVR
jgi:hypothetical protein